MTRQGKIDRWVVKYCKATSKEAVAEALKCEGNAVTKIIVRMVADPVHTVHLDVCNNWYRRVKKLSENLSHSTSATMGEGCFWPPVWVLFIRHFNGLLDENELARVIGDGMIAYTVRVVDETPRHLAGSFN